ncbi:MAG TPA: bifunctional demethylmenaquinone methyltransferase/2-methoxy-6-polyprenyl-1,4-benzoquinol methylase UbiE [Peptococcaceae bacterium]|nr:bifunctional demethylmenaquinone methyltransferase/2-methoxy-6-polyprenyl-1,4-benzoquinol methylase UbiE [Peptococcaceae bacterium]
MNYQGKDKAQYVRTMFNSIAGRYDLLNTLMSLGMDQSWRRQVVQTVRAEKGMKILDVCCGTGKLTKELAKAVLPTGQVVGIDFSENMLKEAWKNLQDLAGQENIKLIQGDALNLPFASNSFDGATVGWGLRNLPDLRQGIREMIRVVKPGSMVVSLDMGKPTMPVFKQLYWLYFKKVVPLLGKIWAGKQQEYNYLYQSACEFESQRELARIFQECGLTETGYKDLAGGVVAVVYGRK